MNLEEAHDHSSNHRAEIEASELCACFYCCRFFRPQDIKEWIDRRDPGGTAVCPYCGIDAVLGSASGLPMGSQFLEEMHDHWFKRGTSYRMQDGKLVEVRFHIDKDGNHIEET